VVGVVQPVEEIAAAARRAGALMLADCAQTAGVLPVHAGDMGLDVFFTTGHKSLFGPPGTGLLYVREGIADMRAWREGGSGDSKEFHPEEYPAHLEGGTMNTWGAVGLAEGIRFVQETGVEKIQRKEREFTEQIFDALEADPRFFLYGSRKAPRTGVVTLNIQGVDPAVAGSILDERWGVCVRTGKHCAPGAHAFFAQEKGGLRLSPGWFTTAGELGTALDALREIAAEMAAAPRSAASS
jgi:selenocysteine lyase/cysteine desulfurase